MIPWIPVVGTLAGAALAGTISILVALITLKYSRRNAELALKEERAKWAVERRLAALQRLYGNLERLQDAVSKLRIQQAWENTKIREGTEPPPWVLSFDDAYMGWERALDEIIAETLFNEEWIIEEFEKAREQGLQWFVESDREKGVLALNQLEYDIAEFRRRIAKRYRETFDGRRRGVDVED